jgi:DNA polymerase-3 subunit delta'
VSWLPLVGHEAVLARLEHAAAAGRLAHAYLFVGPEGIGKKRFARHLAQALLCAEAEPGKLKPCRRCAACRRLEADNHPDYLEVAKPDDKNELPIATIHQLCADLALKPVNGTRRVAVVDDADFLNEESANCFLKTLEEPPIGSLLLLLATSEERQLPTIVSRCQALRFHPLTDEQVAKILLGIGAVADAGRAAKIAALGQGSAGQAVELAEPAWQDMMHKLFAGLADLPASSIRLSKEIAPFVDAAGKDAAAKRARVRRLVRLAAEFFRAAVQLRETNETSVAGDERTWVESVAHRVDTDVLLDLLERCLQADLHIGRFLNQTLSVDCWIDDLGQIAAGLYVPMVGEMR